jgi:CRP-like cAMP-binding protein
MEIASYLTYESFDEGELVFEYGTVGENFYVVLKGAVSVLIPN